MKSEKKKNSPVEPVVTTSGGTGTSFFKQLQNTKMGRMLVFILLFTFIFKVINYILSFFNIGQELIYTYMVWFMIMFFLFVLLPMTRSYVKLPNIQTTKSNTNPTDGMMEVATAGNAAGATAGNVAGNVAEVEAGNVAGATAGNVAEVEATVGTVNTEGTEARRPIYRRHDSDEKADYDEDEDTHVTRSGRSSGAGTGTPIHKVLTRALMNKSTPGTRYQGYP
jgi:hypothetical protein